MKFYETFFIINAAPDAIDAQIQRVVDLISSNKGEVISIDRWGMRKLAYEIQRTSQGYYACIYFKSPESLPGILENYYKLNEMYLRHLTVVSIHTPEEIAAKAEKAATESRVMGMEPTEELALQPSETAKESAREETSDEQLDTTDETAEGPEEGEDVSPDEGEKKSPLDSGELEEEKDKWSAEEN